MEQKFKLGDIVRYNGNIYQIVGIQIWKQSHIYDVKCLKNNFPDEPVSSAIGSCAEDEMELVDFTEPADKKQWIDKACEWLRNNFRQSPYDNTKVITHYASMEDAVQDFQKYMEKTI